MTGSPSQTSRASLSARRWLARVSNVTRTLAVHERVTAFSTALVCALVAFGPRISGGGLEADDWAEYADLRFHDALGYHSALGALQASAGSRVGATLYWLAGFSLFGEHTRFYTLLAALLAAVMAFSIYVLLRELRFSITQSLAMMLLTISIPVLATARFWFTPSGSQLALALFFFGLTLALRAFSAGGKTGLRLHVASWVLYVLSACYAEVALPLMVVAVLVYLTRGPIVASLRRWACDLVIVIVGYATTLSYVNTTAGFNKLPRSMWGEHARLLGEEALTIFTRTLTQSSAVSHLGVLAGMAVLAAIGLYLALDRRTSDGARRGMRRWGIAFFISFVAIVAYFTTYVPAMLYYEPLSPGLPSHIDIVIAAPLAVGVFAVVMFAVVVIGELVDRLHAPSGRYVPALAVLWLIVAVFTGVRDTRSDGRVWAEAATRGRDVLNALTANLPKPLPGSTVYTFGEAGTVAVGLPVFFSSFELTNAVKVAYGRGDVSAYPVVTDDDAIDCGPNGIAAVAGAVPLNPPSPYGRSYFFDVPSRTYRRIDSAAGCRTALSIFPTGPYATTPTLEWSL